MSFKIYRFICSKEVSGPISKLRYIDNSMILNRKIPLNSSISEIAKYFGKNIQRQTNNYFSDLDLDIFLFKNCYVYKENNKLIFEGKIIGSTINSRDSILSFIQSEDIKNINCIIYGEGNNRFNMECKPTFRIKADLSNNNGVYIDDLDLIGMMIFEEGKSLAKFEFEGNQTDESPIISERKSKTLIFVIIILFIALIVIIIIIILCKYKSDSKPTEQKNDKNPPSHLNDLSSETSKEKSTTQDITLGLGENISQKWTWPLII